MHFTGGESYPELLQRTDIHILTNADCMELWDSDINDGHICIFRLADNESVM